MRVGWVERSVTHRLLDFPYDLSVTFFSFFNRGGREEGTENTETCQDILCDLIGQENSRVSGLKTQKGYTLLIFSPLPDTLSRGGGFPFADYYGSDAYLSLPSMRQTSPQQLGRPVPSLPAVP